MYKTESDMMRTLESMADKKKIGQKELNKQRNQDKTLIDNKVSLYSYGERKQKASKLNQIMAQESIVT